MIQQDYYYGDESAAWAGWEAPHQDYLQLIRCMWVFAGTCLLAGLIYIFVRDIKIAAVICGIVAVGLSLYHTPFGLFILFSLQAIENAVVLNPYFTISKIMGLIVLTSFILNLSRFHIILTTPLKLLIVLACWALLTVTWSLTPVYTVLPCLTLVLNIGLAVIILSTVADKKSLFLVVSGFALGGFLTSMIIHGGFVAYQSRSAEEMGRVVVHEDTSPVVLALALCLSILSAFHTFFQRGRIKKVLAVIIMAAVFLAMVRTQSRTAAVSALAIPVLALILASKSGNRLKYFFGAIIVAVVAVLAVRWVLNSDMLPQIARERLTVQQQGFAESGRLQYWKWGLDGFVRRPLHGYGLANFHLIPTNLGNKSAHNNVVAIAVELGLVGLLLFAALFFILYKQISRISDTGLRWLGFAFLLYPWVTGITTTTYTKKEFWYVVGIIMVIGNIGRLQREQERQMSWTQLPEQYIFSEVPVDDPYRQESQE